MALALDFFNQNRQTFDEMVDETTRELLQREGLLQTYFPIRTYTDPEVLVMSVRQNNAIAHILGVDGEIPDSKGGSLQIAAYQPVKIGKSFIYDESLQKLIYRWQQTVTGLPDDVRDLLFGGVTGLPQAILDAHNMLLAQAMTTGAVSYTDAITEVKVEVSYPRLSWQFPANLSAGARWNQPTTAQGLANLSDHCRDYRNVHGVNPDVVLNENTYRTLRDQEATKRAAIAAKGGTIPADLTSYVPSPEEMRDLFSRYEIGTIQIFNEKYKLPSGAEEYFIPNGFYAFGSANMGRSGLLPVVSNSNQPGISTFVEQVGGREPAKDRAVGVAETAFVASDLRKLGGRRVY